MQKLPIDDVLDKLKDGLSVQSNAVLIAAPGAGKTTRVPLALLAEAWLKGQKIIMLEPRRLAARSAAGYMAKLLGEKVGETVGYRVRLDSRVGPATRIEVVTEGILTRMMQTDPSLDNVGAVIFDEFHERNLHADVGLALCLEAQSVLRPDLRIIIMSATLNAQPVAELLGNAPVIVSSGREFAVETIYLDRPVLGRIEPVIIKTILEALRNDSGDILVFLPGAGEIRRVERQLREMNLAGVSIAPLYGNLPQDMQDNAIAPSDGGWRKVVLATSIAETSLTVQGIGVVIDSGLMRIPRFSSRTGMTRLETIQVSRASADQRRGRAGRLGPGICYRLLTKEADLRLIECQQPEILESDLAPLALDLAAWGVNQPNELAWLNPPPLAAFEQARTLLFELGAIDTAGKITAHGRKMAACGVHPRLAHMIIKAESLNLGGLACEIAALLGERDLLAGSQQDVDIRLRLEMLHRQDTAIRPIIKAEIAHLKQVFSITSCQTQDIDACGLLLALAYPDRIAQRRSNGKYLLRNGRGAALLSEQALSEAAWLAIAQLDDQGSDSRIFLAAPLDAADLVTHFREQIEVCDVIAWDSSSKAVRARRFHKLGALTIKEEALLNPDPEMVAAALISGIKTEGLDILPWTRAARSLQQRLIFMHCHEQGYPDMTDNALLDASEEWLAPYLYGLSSKADLDKLNLFQILESRLNWEQRNLLDEYAPTHITVPSGQRIQVDYSNSDSPVLAVRLQEMFGQKETPRIARGRVALTVHLLSPAHRPVQVTQDLANFWETTYFEVKKDLAGRYPKHYWPDDPLAAQATHRAKPKLQ
ncbi:MAG: ATP-dependent helicase HrpB [Veillonellaceae bacterium]|jgi:ATP-dependent helicase HrpB|nr:ATP-dependent helicase HrpB [Veillonellaceae bacterium]